MGYKVGLDVLKLGGVAASPRAQWDSCKQEKFLENAVFLSSGMALTTVVLYVLETYFTVMSHSRIPEIERFVFSHNCKKC